MLKHSIYYMFSSLVVQILCSKGTDMNDDSLGKEIIELLLIFIDLILLYILLYMFYNTTVGRDIYLFFTIRCVIKFGECWHTILLRLSQIM